jgi:hypothetical protein
MENRYRVVLVFGSLVMLIALGKFGSFVGLWAGGWLFDRTGSYDVVWIIAAALVQAFAGRWPLGVERMIPSSSSVMSAGMSANSGVDR